MHSAIAVANHIIQRAQAAKSTLEGGQLHGLVYFAHGLRLALVNLPLLDEPIYADAQGVVIEGLQQVGAGTGTKVQALLGKIEKNHNGVLEELVPTLDPDEPAITTIDLVWNRFGMFSAQHLGVFVRGGGSPWDATWNDPARMGGEAPVPMLNSRIRQWFRELVIQENRDLAAADGLDKTVMLARAKLEQTLNKKPD